MQNQPLLEMQNISKSFPGVKALNQVSLTVYGGTVHALMGENGAGKSTLMKCLFGMYEKDSGTVLLQNKPVHFKNAGEALKNGVAMVHQELNQALQRSVADNLWLGRYPKKGLFVDTKKMIADTQKLFQDIGFSVDSNRIMATMSVSQRQMAEIAKAISYDAKILVFDEPTSSLNEAEVNRLFSIIRMLKQRGCGIIYISHKMAEILKISDTVTVLRDGCHVATKPAADLTTDAIIQLMVGRKLSNQFPPKTNLPGAVALKVEHLTARHNALFDVSFEARQGEILGISGLDGSGRTELLENLFGISARKSGAIYLHGQKIANRTPREAIHSGFALITEERRASGIFGNLGILDNTVISALKKHRKFGLLGEKSMRRDTDWAIRTLRIKTPNQKTKIRTLSGGNQQKVIFGRWLLTKPEILLLDEPTRGIDVGAKYEIYSLIMHLAQNGKTVLLVSSEMPELLGLCDRILVMSGGRLAGSVNAKTATQEEMMQLASKYV